MFWRISDGRILLGLALCCASWGCQETASPPGASPASSLAAGKIDVADLRPQIEAFCGDCHSTPPAGSFPKDAWAFEVERGYDFYYESFREDLKPPPQHAVVAYFESLAPAELHVPPAPADPSSTPLKFVTADTPAPDIEPPAVSFITWTKLQQDQPPQLVFCDMRSGELRVARRQGGQYQCELLTTCAHPGHVEPCDLDGDGQLELVVAELGSAESGDHARGAVIWLRPAADGWQQRLLLSGVGRVADVRPGDFDGDGDSDLLVAEFGHFYTGRILLLENTSVLDGVPRFTEHVLDRRHGTIHVPTADLNGDGRLDFVALVSQEYEVVEAFLNQGDWSFRRELIFSGNDPAYGSSGIQLVDLDADDDLDVLYSNGDTFGSEHLKPYHGIHWLENRGQYPFEDRFLAHMVGVQKAVAGDMDGDDDLDVVGVAFMPRNLIGRPELKDHDSVIWLEQAEDGSFVRHGLQRGQFIHAAVELADLDDDGDTDLAVGNMHPDDRLAEPWLTLWWNQRSLGQGD